MSEIELPEPQLLGAEVAGHVAEFYGYTAEQVCQIIAAERERCARMCEGLLVDDGQMDCAPLLNAAAAIRRG